MAKEVYKTNEKEKIQQSKRSRRIILGFVVFIFTTIGMLSLLFFLVDMGKLMMDDTKERKQIESDVYTLVMLQIIPFETPELADEKTIIAAAMWNVFFEEGRDKLIQDSQTGSYLISVADIEKHITKLFGPEFKVTHENFILEDGTNFVYKKDTNNYLMPIASVTNAYYPKVVEIDNEKGAKTVTIGYVKPSDDFVKVGSEVVENEASQYFDFIYKKNGKVYYLESVVPSEYKPVVKENDKKLNEELLAIEENNQDILLENAVEEIIK